MARPSLPAVGDLANSNWGQKIIDAINTISDKADAPTIPDGAITNAKVSTTAAISLDKTVDTTNRATVTSTERARLAAVATGATKNSTDAQLRDRTTHTGVQQISSIDGLQTALDSKLSSASLANMPAGYTHSMAYSSATTFSTRAAALGTTRTDIFVRIYGQTSSDADITWLANGDYSQIAST